jgi:hypothetical protein
MNLTRYGNSSTTTLVKKSTIGEYLGNSSGGGDPFYLTSGFVYKKVNIFSGTDYGEIYLVPPSATVADAPTNGNTWISSSSSWRILEFTSYDGTSSTIFGSNSSTSTTTIPTTGWVADPNHPAISDNPNGVTAVSITLPA